MLFQKMSDNRRFNDDVIGIWQKIEGLNYNTNSLADLNFNRTPLNPEFSQNNRRPNQYTVEREKWISLPELFSGRRHCISTNRNTQSWGIREEAVLLNYYSYIL